MRKLFPLLLLILSLHSFGQKTDTSFYSIVNLGKVIGEDKVWRTTPNEYHYYFYYNDRGRGPVTNATVRTNANGKIETVTSSGVDYYKVPYTSTYQKINDSLISQYNTERTADPDTGQYYDYSETFSSTELMIKALLRSPARKLLAQGGDSVSMKAPLLYNIPFNKKKIKLFLCDINFGKGSSPFFVWVDENYQFFADVSNWTNAIKKNFESLVDTLHSLQETQAIPFYQGIYKKLSDPLPAKLAIAHVTLFDAPNARTIPGRTVLIEKGMITMVGDASQIKIPAGFIIIEGKGKTLIPGLWDTHCHYSKNSGTGYLSGGITHVRDMGNMPDIKQMQQNIRLHNLTGPDISYLSGFIDKDDEYHGPVGKLVLSQKEAVNAVAYYHKAGYDQIKIYSSIDTGWVKAMAAAAHSMHMRVAGHIPVHMTAANAVRDGYNEITHLNMVMLNFFPDTIDTRKNRFIPVGRNANSIDLNGPAVKSFIQLLKEKKTVVEPTISLFNEMFNSFPGDTTPTYKPVINWMKPSMRKNTIVNSFVDDTTHIPAYRESYKRMMQMLKLLYDNGIPLLAGTDGGAQLALHSELELFVKAGMPANEVLRMATFGPAKIFKLNTQYGSIERNRVADLILVDGNPAENMSDIRKVFMVVTNHSLYYPKKLYQYADWGYYY